MPAKGWAEMIRKVYEIDPMVCPQCGGTMKLIVFITDFSGVDRIVNHLKLMFPPSRRLARRHGPAGASRPWPGGRWHTKIDTTLTTFILAAHIFVCEEDAPHVEKEHSPASPSDTHERPAGSELRDADPEEHAEDSCDLLSHGSDCQRQRRPARRDPARGQDGQEEEGPGHPDRITGL